MAYSFSISSMVEIKPMKNKRKINDIINYNAKLIDLAEGVVHNLCYLWVC